MMEKFRLFLNTAAGKVVSALFCLGLVTTAVYVIRGSMGSDTPDEARYTYFVDSETGETVKHVNELGESFPLENPKTHKKNLYPAEACYWTTDGKIKETPDHVLLNDTVGKSGPTFCPFCHRKVVSHNPRPTPGYKPPMSETEFKAGQGG